jgi:predicted nucleic acid-binding protein
MPGSFFDSNVLIHLASADAGKAERAERIVACSDDDFPTEGKAVLDRLCFLV